MLLVPATPAENPDAWFEIPELAGRLVRLVPLGLEHTEGYLAAANPGEEVFEFTGAYRTIDTFEQARADITRLLDARERRESLPFAQLDATTGQVIGVTTYYEISPASRSIAIGGTWLGRRWWRTGHNTESKLLLLTHCFETLGAARVVWHTDILNLRSQAAITRLGATREGVLRKHRIRRDGTWRDTVQYSMTDDDWPPVRERLRNSLAHH